MSTEIERMEEEADQLWHETYDKKEEKTPEQVALEKKEAEKKPDETPKKEEPAKEPEKPAEEDFKHKYEVLKGKYDAEVPRLAFDLAETKGKIADLEKKVSEPKPEPKKEEPKPLSPTLENLKKEYPDIFEGTKELTQTMIQEKLDEFKKTMTQRVDDTVGKVTETVEKSDRERYKDTLDRDEDIGKAWRVINEDPKFAEWVNQQDPYAGVPRSVLLRDAWDKMDTSRTLNFFKNFKKETTVTPPEEEIPEDKKVEKKPKEPDIAPPRGGGGGTPPMDDKKVITRETYLEFLDEREKPNGKWKGREKEADIEEARLHAAVFKKKP